MIPALMAGWNGATSWLSKNPIVLAIGALLIAILGWEKVKSDIKSAAKKAERNAIAAKQAKESMQRVDAFNDARDTVLNLPDDELRQRTNGDPNNRGLVPRD